MLITLFHKCLLSFCGQGTEAYTFSASLLRETEIYKNILSTEIATMSMSNIHEKKQTKTEKTVTVRQEAIPEIDVSERTSPRRVFQGRGH